MSGWPWYLWACAAQVVWAAIMLVVEMRAGRGHMVAAWGVIANVWACCGLTIWSLK